MTRATDESDSVLIHQDGMVRFENASIRWASRCVMPDLSTLSYDFITPTFIALLRAINFGGTGKLPMANRKKFREGAGVHSIVTYIQFGNVVFDSSPTERGSK